MMTFAPDNSSQARIHLEKRKAGGRGDTTHVVATVSFDRRSRRTMKIGVTQLGEALGQLCTFLEHLFIDALATGINHAVEINHGADFETVEIPVSNRQFQTDCFSLYSGIGHSIVSLRM